MNVLEEIKPIVLQLRGKKYRLRRMFRVIRKAKKFTDLSDLILLNSIVIILKDYKYYFSKKEVYSAFKLVDKTDYDTSIKKPILAFLLKGARNSSAFKKG